jgi:hypothetical protein
MGSTIIGLEDHTPENIEQVIDFAVEHDTDFHQFMLYTPIPGTPLYEEHRAAGTLLSEDECSLADTHGQTRFNYRHAHIKDGRETAFLREAFARDFRVNGPSIIRMIRTLLQGWRAHRNHPEPRVRARFARELEPMSTTYAGAVWAAERWYRDEPVLHRDMTELLHEIYREFGWKARAAGPALGAVMYAGLRRESARLSRGATHEPQCVREVNEAAATLERAHPWLRIPPTSEIAWVCPEEPPGFVLGPA